MRGIKMGEGYYSPSPIISGFLFQFVHIWTFAKFSEFFGDNAPEDLHGLELCPTLHTFPSADHDSVLQLPSGVYRTVSPALRTHPCGIFCCQRYMTGIFLHSSPSLPRLSAGSDNTFLACKSRVASSTYTSHTGFSPYRTSQGANFSGPTIALICSSILAFA